MTTYKSNGDPLEGTMALPGKYPNPVDANVNMHSIEWAYGVGNKLIGADTQPPTAPSNVTSANVTQTAADVSWTGSLDDRAVTGYRVKNGSSVLTTVTGTTAHLTGLTAATAYTLSVYAIDAAGNQSTGANVTFTTSS